MTLQLDGADRDVATRIYDRLDEIQRLLGDAPAAADDVRTTGDPLIDAWEREYAEGRKPDLTEGLPNWVMDRVGIKRTVGDKGPKK